MPIFEKAILTSASTSFLFPITHPAPLRPVVEASEERAQVALQRRQPEATEKTAREPNGRQVLQVRAMFVPRETMLHVVPRFLRSSRADLEKRVCPVLKLSLWLVA